MMASFNDHPDESARSEMHQVAQDPDGAITQFSQHEPKALRIPLPSFKELGVIDPGPVPRTIIDY